MDIINIAKIIENAGGKLYLVGGAIRNEILNIPIEDEDYCITNLTANKFKELFPESFIKGNSFEVFEIDKKEFAIARREKKSGLGHKEFEIETDNVTIEEDLKRRDITINSIAKEVLSGKIIDPFNGVKDIKNKIIRATSDKFIEDPLRVYRVARFASLLEFEVEKNTIQMMKNLKEELKYLAPERVFEELKKALISKSPSIFFETLKEASVLDIHFKEIYDLIGALQPEEYHPEGDAFNHTMLVVNESAKQTDKLDIRFAALVHDLGKGVTPLKEYPHHYNHEKKGVDLVEKLGNRIKAPTNWIKCGKTACLEHMRGGIFSRMKPSKKVEFIERVNKTNLGLKGLQIVVNSDKLSSRNTNIEDISFEKIGKQCLEVINGKYIQEKYNVEKSKKIAELLHQERINWMKEKIEK